MSTTSYPFGLGGDLRFASNRGRSNDGRARAGIRYPSPFFDIGHTYLPPNLKSLLKWCRYYFCTNPIINSSVSKMAAYPLTDLHYDTKNEGHQKTWDEFLMRRMGLRSFLYGVGLDYFCYGNAFVGISFPFRKLLVCRHCGHRHHIKEIDYRFMNYEYRGTCRKCYTFGAFVVHDQYVRASSDINLMRWNPENIDIEYNAYNGKKRILYHVPTSLRNDIRLGKRAVIEDVPDIYIQAVKRNKPMRLDRVYHFARPTISQNARNMGWGISMILPVLKDTYYMQMLRKAQEMIAQEHIVPLRYMFPQAGSSTSDPYSMMNLGSNWVPKVQAEIEQWKIDQNHIVLSPVPMGNQSVGGDGRALLLAQEMRLIEEEIIAGMGVPIEFVKGGVSFSGTSLSMHILKNQFESYRRFVLELIQNFIIGEISTYMGWEPIKVRLKRFHMADDLQRASLTFQLNQAAKVSDATMLSELNYDNTEEVERIRLESAEQLRNMGFQQAQQAHMLGESMKIQGRYQQSMMMEQQQPEMMQAELAQHPQGVQSPLGQAPPLGEPQVDVDEMSRHMANQLSQMDDKSMYTNLHSLQPYPEIHGRVMGHLNNMRGRANSAPLPIPLQKPPRRGPSEAVM